MARKRQADPVGSRAARRPSLPGCRPLRALDSRRRTMFFTDGKLQYPVRVDRPNPLFARALQQAIGGGEGEIRGVMQYLLQSWGARGPKKYRDMLLATGTEEIGHIEMLATAVALNLEGAPLSLTEAAGAEPAVLGVLGGMNLRRFGSPGVAPTPANASGVPFTAAYVD